MKWLKWGAAVLLAWWLADALGSNAFAFVVLAGVAGGLMWRASRRVDALEAALKAANERLDRLEKRALGDAPAADAAAAAPSSGAYLDERGAWVEPADVTPPSAAPAPAADPQTPASNETPPVWPPALAAAAAAPVDERSATVTSSVGQSVLAWFRGGNTIVRAAVLILFIGVAFLLRYAAEHATVPIEFRIAAVALGGVVLAAIGWRLRSSRRGYGLSLQGAGVGILYLAIFAAFRLYGLLPAGLAFALLIVMAAVTALLSVLQNALPLAVLGFSGGFLAPVLASTGQGSHVALFGYYLVLNAAIAWIASRQAWKLLNLIGFVFTFSIGAAWGAKAYRPELFASTEPFLVAHFLLYLFISAQYSKRLTAPGAPPGLAYVDGGLLFGVPIAAFGLQAAMVKDMPYALALSSAALSGIYLVLGRWLWRRGGEQLRLLTEGLLALGLVFLILVTPLALDARWTGAAWALQGAGIVWIGLRQKRWWAAGIGVVLQLGAAVSFWDAHSQGRDDDAARGGAAVATAFANGWFVGALVLALSALFTAWLLQRWAHTAVPEGAAPAAADEASAEPAADSAAPPAASAEPAAAAAVDPGALARGVHWMMLLFGLMQGLAGTWAEWERVVWPGLDAPLRLGLMFAATAVVLDAAQRRLRWPELGVPGRALLLAALAWSLCIALFEVFDAPQPWRHYAGGYGALEALVLLAVGLWLQWRLAVPDASRWRRPWTVEPLALAWFASVHGSLMLYGLTAHLVARHEAWTPLAALVPPTLLAWWLLSRADAMRWPLARAAPAWLAAYFLPLALLQALWSLGVDALADGGMAPLPYLPLVNPIDLGHGLLALYALKLWRSQRLGERALAMPLRVAAAAAAFCWASSLVVRSLHHWAGTPMWFDGALSHDLVQTGLTITWALIALVTMSWATRRASPGAARPVWLCGAALLGVVVVKLFVVDLSNIGTLARIVSFLGVGGLMLVIGYVSPMPPARPAPAAASVPEAAP